MLDDIKHWKHITKLDPDKENTTEILSTVIESGTDAIMISGTQGITKEKVQNLFDQLSDYDLPIILEPANRESLIYDEKISHVFIPLVLNTTNLRWLIQEHLKWIESLLSLGFVQILGDLVNPEGYIVLNPNSAVAKYTECNCDLTHEKILSYAVYGEFIGLPIIYIEYSGTYGNPKIVEAVKENLQKATLFYGGGITDGDKAKEMSRHADTIIVGNICYTDLDKYRETIVR
ncbi:MAG: heptaprenylglyceryl phosphate synthase [Candidatus Hodarchaeota archaeon]